MEKAISVARIDQREYVRMLELRRDGDFPDEAVGADGLTCLAVENLYGNDASMAKITGKVDGGHPAVADLSLYLVTVRECGVKATDVVGHWCLREGTRSREEIVSHDTSYRSAN